MTRSPQTVTAATTISEAWLVMVTLNVRHLIITNEQGGIIGLVSDTDFATQPVPPRNGEDLGNQTASPTASVSTIMSRTRIVIEADEDTEEAVDLMIENKMGALAVIDPEGDIVGIVSYPDVMKCSAIRPEGWR